MREYRLDRSADSDRVCTALSILPGHIKVCSWTLWSVEVASHSSSNTNSSTDKNETSTTHSPLFHQAHNECSHLVPKKTTDKFSGDHELYRI